MAGDMRTIQLDSYVVTYEKTLLGAATFVLPESQHRNHFTVNWSQGFFVEIKDNVVVNHNLPPLLGYLQIRLESGAVILQLNQGTLRIPRPVQAKSLTLS